MNIVVCVKEVPNPCFPVEIDAERDIIKDQDWNYVINPYDEVAVEEAVRIKEKFGGEVIVVTLGTRRVEEILRKCLAIGADRAILLCDENVSGRDAYSTTLILSKMISQLSFDIILCGLKSIDNCDGEVGIMIAEMLGLPVITTVAKLEISSDHKSALVSRRLERGAREVKQCPLPAVFTTDLVLNEPRYPTLPGIKYSLKKEVKIYTLESLDIDKSVLELENQLTRVISVSRPPPKKIFIPTGNLSPVERLTLLTQGVTAKKSSGNLLEGNVNEVAKKITDFLVERRFLP